MNRLTERELDRRIDKQARALIDHLERRNSIPRIGRAVIPLRSPWWSRLWSAIKECMA